MISRLQEIKDQVVTARALAKGDRETAKRLITALPEFEVPVCRDPKPSVWLKDIVEWQRWDATYGDRSLQKVYPDEEAMNPPLGDLDALVADFVTEEKRSSETVDIRHVEGLAAAKEFSHTTYRDMDEMARLSCRGLIKEKTLSAIKDLLRWPEVRINEHGTGSDRFEIIGWLNDRCYLVNAGGAHHFAAARYIAREIGEPVYLKAEATRYSLNPQTIESIRKGYSAFIIPKCRFFTELYLELGRRGVTFASKSAPEALASRPSEVVFFPRDRPRSALFANALAELGFPSLFDVVDLSPTPGLQAPAGRSRPLR